MKSLKSTERDFLFLHAAFAIGAGLALLVPAGTLGGRLFLLLLAYNAAIPLIGHWRKHERWLDLWAFVFPLSLLQILPDWFLSSVLGTLVFPDSGFPYVGSVPLFMGLMWSVPFFVILFVTWRLRSRLSTLGAYTLAAGLCLAMFAVAEATLWMVPVWHAAPQVYAPGHVAVYVLAAEFVLGLILWHVYQIVANRPFAVKLVGAALVMIVYTGSLSVFYLLIEQQGRGTSIPGSPAAIPAQVEQR